jgi:import inner membrane translocase subunit TIM16
VQKRLPLPEAAQILDVTADVKPDVLYDKYRKLYEANAVEKGGSFYLQSKIYRAKEAFEQDWAVKNGRLGGAAAGHKKVA